VVRECGVRERGEKGLERGNNVRECGENTARTWRREDIDREKEGRMG
jgi:hypothetical protein